MSTAEDHHTAEHETRHTHAHDHQHGGEDFDWEAMAEKLEREAELNAGSVRQTLAWLRELLDSQPNTGTTRAGTTPGAPTADDTGPTATGSEVVYRALDVGSGPGVNTTLLAHAFPQAELVAVDGSAPLLERAERRAEAEGLAHRVHTVQAELPDEFDKLGSADLIWISNVLHHLGDQQAALSSLASTLRPGGLLAVAERGLPLRYLPRDIGIGRPGLLARLEAHHEDWFANMRAALPGSTPVTEHWPGLLAEAGLTPSGSRSFLTEAPTPLADSTREQLHQQLSRMRDVLQDELDAEDLATIDQLLDPTSASGVLRRPDAFYLTTTTVHTAIRPKSAS